MPADFQHADERQMFREIADGNEAAFEMIYRLYVPQLSSFLRRFSLTDREADEVIQETFLRLWMQRDKLPAVEFPKAWVFRISSNIVFNFLKRSMKEEEVRQAASAFTKEEYNDTEEKLHLHQLMRAIAQAVEELSPQRKRIYLLSRNEGMTIPEIAGNLGLSPSTVKNTLISSLQLIRDYLIQRGYDISFFLLLIIPATLPSIRFFHPAQ